MSDGALFEYCNLIRMLSTKANGREPKSCSRQLFNFKFGHFSTECDCMANTSMPTSRVESKMDLIVTLGIYDGCHYAECCYAEYRFLFVVMLSVVILNKK